MKIFRPVFAAIVLVLAGCASVKTTQMTPTPTGIVAVAIAGKGLPVVVLQSGLGDGKAPWAPVYSALAETNTVFAYDRPGYGDSPATKSPRDPCTIATELRNALRAANLPPPYVLVGHSLGGLYQYAFAKLYPDDVAALVLLDPTHPDHWRRMQTESPATATLLKGIRATAFDAASRSEFDNQAVCIERIDMRTPLSIPVRLLVRTQFQAIESGPFETMVHSLESDWQKMLGASEINRVAGSGHYIQKDRPEVVIQQIRSVAGK